MHTSSAQLGTQKLWRALFSTLIWLTSTWYILPLHDCMLLFHMTLTQGAQNRDMKFFPGYSPKSYQSNLDHVAVRVIQRQLCHAESSSLAQSRVELFFPFHWGVESQAPSSSSHEAVGCTCENLVIFWFLFFDPCMVHCRPSCSAPNPATRTGTSLQLLQCLWQMEQMDNSFLNYRVALPMSFITPVWSRHVSSAWPSSSPHAHSLFPVFTWFFIPVHCQ